MEILNWINTNFDAVLYTTIFGYIASAFVQALPDPDSESGKVYRFFYKFAHLLVANWKLVSKQNKEDKSEKMTIFNREE